MEVKYSRKDMEWKDVEIKKGRNEDSVILIDVLKA